jgi:hypothetical protein
VNKETTKIVKLARESVGEAVDSMNDLLASHFQELIKEEPEAPI